MKINRATPVLFVDRVEPTRDFFTRVGFTVFVDVPEGDHLGFALLEKDGCQVMVETKGNGREKPELQALSRESRRALVFVEVDDVEAVMKALSGARIAVARHSTFYGADEITYEEPAGNLVTFAKFDRPA